MVGRPLGEIGFDPVADRTGVADFLKRSGFRREVSWIAGRLAFWTIFLMFLLLAAAVLRPSAPAGTLQEAVAYIPNLTVIVLVLVFGA